jgi:transcriptional regulator with XRE-family HTH domain
MLLKQMESVKMPEQEEDKGFPQPADAAGEIAADSFALCNSYNFTAASPTGADVRPFSMSLTDEVASPISAPISTNVIPFRRRSEMRDDHVSMPASLRDSVVLCQRHSVTELRQNVGMPRPPELPKLTSVGERVAWWREHRGMSRKELAAEVGSSSSALSDLEHGRTEKGTFLGKIASVLRLNIHYLETGDGEPEAAYPQEPPPKPEIWPFAGISPDVLKRYNRIELSYLETKLHEGVADIEAERRKSKKIK